MRKSTFLSTALSHDGGNSMNTGPFRLTLFFFVLVCLGLATNGFAAKGGKKGPAAEGISVNVVFRDTQDRIQSDGGGAYASGLANGGAISRFILDLRDTDRELFLAFTVCKSCDTNSQPFTTINTEDAIMFVDVADGSDWNEIEILVDGDENYLGPVDGVLQVNFNYSGVAYGVKFDAASEPGTNYVQIERTAADAWTITAESTDVARLFKRGGKRGSKKRIDIGDYSMPTQFTLIVRSE